MFTRTLRHRAALPLSGCPNSRIQNVASKIHSEWALCQPSLPMKTLKPYNGSERAVDQSLSVA